MDQTASQPSSAGEGQRVERRDSGGPGGPASAGLRRGSRRNRRGPDGRASRYLGGLPRRESLEEEAAGTPVGEGKGVNRFGGSSHSSPQYRVSFFQTQTLADGACALPSWRRSGGGWPRGGRTGPAHDRGPHRRVRYPRQHCRAPTPPPQWRERLDLRAEIRRGTDEEPPLPVPLSAMQASQASHRAVRVRPRRPAVQATAVPLGEPATRGRPQEPNLHGDRSRA